MRRNLSASAAPNHSGNAFGRPRVFGLTVLLIALMKSGEAARARDLLDRRLHCRPSPRDARWRAEV
jgi:hypothetical protein